MNERDLRVKGPVVRGMVMHLGNVAQLRKGKRWEMKLETWGGARPHTL